MRTAHRLFLEQGYHGTSMREIARGAGIAVGGIYNHFSCKEDIFTVVLLEYHPIREVLPALKDARGENVEAFVRDSARRMVATIGERTDFLNLMFIEFVEFKGRHIPEIFHLVFPHILDFVQPLMNGQENLRPFPIPVMLRAYLGLFFSYIITGMLMSRELSAQWEDHTLDDFVDIFLHGILTDK